MYRVMDLDLRQKLVFALYLWHFFTDVLQTFLFDDGQQIIIRICLHRYA